MPATPPKQDKSRDVKADMRMFPWFQEVSRADAELKVSKGIFYLSSFTFDQRVLQTIQMKLLLLFVWAERDVLGCAKAALKFKYEI